jgi:DNA polymerase
MSLSREQILQEMGIGPLWVWRSPEAMAPGTASITDRQASPEAVAEDRAPAVPPAAAPTIDPPPAPAPLSPPAPRVENAGQGESPSTVDAAEWPELLQQIAECRACGLCQQRRQAVPGVGDRQPDWLFIGEGPGAEEDARGEPFVGQAGKLLDNMLAALGLKRGEKVYIANAVKCRPPGNRTPEAAEMAACRPFLERQIALLKPRIIVLLGKAAVHSVLHEDKSLASLRGQVRDYRGIPVIVTYHPAYLLRNLPDKAKAWEDLLLARRTVGG